MEPEFLSIEDILLLHEESLARYGGLNGLRDEAGFRSAVEQPKMTYYYGRGDVFDIAAAYAFHIAQAQAFLDGNKRTGVGAGLLFLEMNEVWTSTDDLALYQATIAVAEKRMDKAGLAALLRSSALG